MELVAGGDAECFMAAFAADDLIGPLAGNVESQATAAGEADAGVIILDGGLP